MKIRTGFVTNSSSSSFVLIKKGLTEQQIKDVLDLDKTAEKLKLPYCECAYEWRIDSEDELKIQGSTYIDNFSIGDLFSALQIPRTNYVINYD